MVMVFLTCRTYPMCNICPARRTDLHAPSHPPPVVRFVISQTRTGDDIWQYASRSTVRVILIDVVSVASMIGRMLAM